MTVKVIHAHIKSEWRTENWKLKMRERERERFGVSVWVSGCYIIYSKGMSVLVSHVSITNNWISTVLE